MYVIIRRTNWFNLNTGERSRPDVFIGYCKTSDQSAKIVRERNKKANGCFYYSKKLKCLPLV
jgi:hypothetical protein